MLEYCTCIISINSQKKHVPRELISPIRIESWTYSMINEGTHLHINSKTIQGVGDVTAFCVTYLAGYYVIKIGF